MRQFDRTVLTVAFAGLLLAPAPAFAVDDGETVFNDVCLQCHSPQQRPLTDKHLTREQWREAIDKMMALGTDIPKKKIAPLLEYLVRTHGPQGAENPAPR